MTKDELVNAVANQAGISKSQASTAVNALTDIVASALSKGGSVTLTGFGTFSVSRRAARQGRNPRTGESLQIPAMNVPRFKAGRLLKDSVK